MVSTSIHIDLDGQKVDSLNLENIPVIPATDKGAEKSKGLVDSLLLEGQHANMLKDMEPKTSQAGGYTLGGLPLYPLS